ncbi:lathosterol oxidase isoform 2-T2 [Ammospiza maritima maritima]
MDLVLEAADRHLLTPYVYPAGWPEAEPCRQLLSLFVITNLGALALYLLFGTLSYYFIFDHELKKHPQFLENQVSREISYALRSLPWISVPTVALFFAEVRGYSKLYDNIEDSPYGWSGVFLSMLSFLFFTDMGIYWIHRGLHHKLFYKSPTWASTSSSTSGPSPSTTAITACRGCCGTSSTALPTTPTTTCTSTTTTGSTSPSGTRLGVRTRAPHPLRAKAPMIICASSERKIRERPTASGPPRKTWEHPMALWPPRLSRLPPGVSFLWLDLVPFLTSHPRLFPTDKESLMT